MRLGMKLMEKLYTIKIFLPKSIVNTFELCSGFTLVLQKGL